MARPDRLLRTYLRDRFLVTTKAGQTWDGIVLDVDDRTLILADASLLGADQSRTKADGQVFVPRADVAYMQRV